MSGRSPVVRACGGRGGAPRQGVPPDLLRTSGAARRARPPPPPPAKPQTLQGRGAGRGASGALTAFDHLWSNSSACVRPKTRRAAGRTCAAPSATGAAAGFKTCRSRRGVRGRQRARPPPPHPRHSNFCGSRPHACTAERNGSNGRADPLNGSNSPGPGSPRASVQGPRAHAPPRASARARRRPRPRRPAPRAPPTARARRLQPAPRQGLRTVRPKPTSPFPRTNRTSLVPPLVLGGHAASLTPGRREAGARGWGRAGEGPGPLSATKLTRGEGQGQGAAGPASFSQPPAPSRGSTPGSARPGAPGPPSPGAAPSSGSAATSSTASSARSAQPPLSGISPSDLCEGRGVSD